MLGIMEGQRYWKVGDHKHVWVVDAILPRKNGTNHYVVLVSEDGMETEDVDLSHIANPELFIRIPDEGGDPLPPPNTPSPDFDREACSGQTSSRVLAGGELHIESRIMSGGELKMPEISPERVCYIIVKAREFDAKVEVDDPGSDSNPTDDRNIDVLEDLRDDPTFEELVSAIDSLNSDDQAELVTLMWIGRGDYGVEN